MIQLRRWPAAVAFVAVIANAFISSVSAAPLTAKAITARSLINAALARGLQSPQEYISGFVLYVRWPDDATITSWQVCVGSATAQTDAHYASLVVRDRPFNVRHVSATDTLAGCHVLDLTATDAAATSALLKAAQTQRGLLTVGNGKAFCSSGGLICLRMNDPQGGFEINLSGVRNAGFSINAKLLMLARPAGTEGAP
jgi:hypothetical protein